MTTKVIISIPHLQDGKQVNIYDVSGDTKTLVKEADGVAVHETIVFGGKQIVIEEVDKGA